MKSILQYLLASLLLCASASSTGNSAFDFDLYNDVLDSEQCEMQLNYIRNNDTSLLIQFIDASWRIPRSILKGNTRDLGNYFQCLDINEYVQNMNIDGKYCIVELPLNQVNFIPPTLTDTNRQEGDASESYLELPLKYLNANKSIFKRDFDEKLFRYTIYNAQEHRRTRSVDSTTITELSFELALCFPKVCTSAQALAFFTNNLTSNLTFTEQFCRLPYDKTWVAADNFAIVLLSLIGLITVLSTAYDIRHIIILDRDPKKVNKIYQSFSIYTNSKNFFVFPSGVNVVTCLDGVRSFAMVWVIICHTFGTQFSFIPENPLDAVEFMTSFWSLWVTSGTITVDTFFLLSGILVVYTTAAKFSRSVFFKNLHLFYLNRLLRMFPVLAFTALMSASFLYRMADGPYFNRIAFIVNDCRNYWWTTLLYVHNFVYDGHICVPHSWYLAVDMQLYLLSPLVLFYVLGQNKRSAWFGMGFTFIAVLAGASVYNFLNNFPSASTSLSRPEDSLWYNIRYYIHTLPRAPPFFVGMMYGYLLHLYRTKKPRISKVLVFFFWVLSFTGTTLVCATTYWNIQPDWDNQLMDNIFNSYTRSIWVASVGWMIFACHIGYGGPINWVLSLHIFKILGRLSYAMYILHYPLIILLNVTALAPIHFSVHSSLMRFLTDFSLAVIASFLVVILVESPFTNLTKMAIDGLKKRSSPKESVH